MQSGKIDEVKKSLNEFYELCGEIRCMHDPLMELLPPEEKERHETWMKAKMMFNDEFVHSVGEWVKSNEKRVSENGNNNDVGGEDDDIDPQ